jgi:predicted MFS family arabinose efflux permease
MLPAGVAAGTVQSAGAAVTLHVIPQRHQGKGQAALNTLLNAAYVTSMALAGMGGDTIGIRNVFVAGGIIALIGVAAATPWLRGAVPPQDVAAAPTPTPVSDPEVEPTLHSGETTPT